MAISVVLVFADHRPSRSVIAERSVTAGELVAREFAEDVASGRRVSLIFRGQLMAPERTLASYGVADGNALHCVVRGPVAGQAAGAGAPAAVEEESFAGIRGLRARELLSWLLLGVLGLVWTPALDPGMRSRLPVVVWILLGLLTLFAISVVRMLAAPRAPAQGAAAPAPERQR
jgi:hypothetical protein